MEARDLEILEGHLEKDEELKTLWEEHILYKKQIDKLEGKSFLNPEEEQKLRELKKLKLDGKTRLQILVDKYRTVE